MVDSSYFKNNKNNSRGGKGNGKLMDRLKKHKWIPLVILILIALAMIAIQYIMLDVLQYSRELAEQQSIFIMRTFREMCHYISQNQQFVTRNEMELLTAKVGTITERQDRMEKKVEFIQKDVTILADNFITDKDKKDFVIFPSVVDT